MARSARSGKLENRTSRFNQEEGKRHSVTIGKGLILVYRRGPQSSTWTAKALTADARYILRALGQADDRVDANGADVLDFYQAQVAARAFADELKLAGGIIAKPVTMSEATESYMAWYKDHRKAVKETEATIHAHILPSLGKALLADLKAPSIRDWHHKLATKPARKRTRKGTRQQYQEKPDTDDGKRARKSTANRILTVLKAILNKAFENNLIRDNTEWRKVKPFENADEPIIRFLTEAEATRLINASRPGFRLLVRGALFTGTRYNELASLQVNHFNPEARSIYIQPSKSGKPHHVPLSADGLAFFSEITTGKTGAEFVFTKQDGTPWGKNHQVRPLKEACKQAKIEPEITFHDLRHTYASLLANRGADLLTISKLLGHADTRITARHYAHLCDKVLANAVNTLLPGFGYEQDKKVKAIR